MRQTMKDKEKQLTSIFIQYQHRIYRLCHSYIKNDEDKLDVFNDIMVRIWRGLEKFDGKSSLSTWIYRITVNTCIDFLRIETKRKRRGSELQTDFLESLADPANVEGDFLLSSQISDLYKCIENLSVLDKTIISLYLEDLGYREIAVVIGISENHVGVKIHRIKNSLNICLQE